MRIPPLSLVWIFFQLSLALAVANLFQIPSGFGSANFWNFLFFAVIAHAVMPEPWRAPFRVILFFAAAWILFGLQSALFLCIMGLVMFVLCDLPIHFYCRVTLVAVFGIVLALYRVERLPWPVGRPVLAVLASLFMFRIFLYLYEHRINPELRAPFWRRLGYFFMLPNVCSSFFPVVDYRTYLDTYYDEDALKIYQKGVVRMALGLSHLLAHRLIRLYWVPAPSEVVNGAGFLAHIITANLLYLMVSGQFHFITGIMALFGHNLPPANCFYFFASSFADYWRRVNAYWASFMTKLFYYPPLLRLRRWGHAFAITASIGWVFFATWLLHGYMRFWLSGRFSLRWMDLVSWEVLGGAVAIQALWETRKGKRAPSRSALREAVFFGLGMSMVFVAVGLRWSVWSFATAKEWADMARQAHLGMADGLRFMAMFIAASAALAVGRLCWVRFRRPGLGAWAPALSVVFCLTLIFLAAPSAAQAGGPRFALFVAKLRVEYSGRGNERYLIPRDPTLAKPSKVIL